MDKSDKVAFTLRLDKDLYENVAKHAKAKNRSLNAQCEYLIKLAFDECYATEEFRIDAKVADAVEKYLKENNFVYEKK